MWAPGSAGAWDYTPGAVPAGFFFIHAIYNPTTKASDVLFSASVADPVMPPGFTARRLVGAAAYNGTSISGMINLGEWTYWAPRGDSVVGASVGATPTLFLLAVPIGCKCQVLADVLASTSDLTGAGITVRDPDLGSYTASLSTANVYHSAGDAARSQMILITDSAGKVLAGSNNAASLLSISVNGFRIDRTVYR